MESELLKVVNDELVALGLNYEYGEYTGDLVYPYIVGEHHEINYSYENNITDGNFILVVFHRGKELDLINIKEQIKNVFADYRASTKSGNVYITYNTKAFVRSGEQDLKKMEIYLDTKTMKGE